MSTVGVKIHFQIVVPGSRQADGMNQSASTELSCQKGNGHSLTVRSKKHREPFGFTLPWPLFAAILKYAD